MKRNLILGSFFTLISACLAAQTNDSQTLMTVGTQPVPLSEFKTMYYNNMSKDSLKSQKALNNYLKLFIEFRLKVNAAMDARLDTTPSFKQEMGEYRTKLAEPKMRDTSVQKALIKEAYDRMKWDIKAEHILLKVAPDATPADTLAAYNKIMKIRTKIMKGDTTFEAAAQKYSDDTYSKDKGGDLGYFTSMGMVYPFETVAYNTKPGDVSKPIRTQFGYHIIKVIDKRADAGQIQIAHIMIRTTAKMLTADSVKAKFKADSIYQLAKQGQDFSELAKKFSQDQSSARRGGLLGWVTIGRYGKVPEFENAAFSLKNIGDITEVKTAYGWHIIKLLDRKPIQAFDSVKESITTRLAKDPRSDLAVDALVVEVKKQYNFKEMPEAKKSFEGAIDDAFYKNKWTTEKAKGYNALMFTIGSKTFTQADFAVFVAKNQQNTGKDLGGAYAVNMLYPKFVRQSVLNFKDSQLEKEDPKFADMLAQYRDGILLFDITDQMVWTKALKDTTGLKQYHETHKNNYMWGERCEASIYTCTNKDVAKEVKKLIKGGKSDKDIMAELNAKAANSVSVASGKYEKKENTIVDANWKKGVSEDMDKDGKVLFVNVKEVLPAQPKTLDEVRGLATTDYQNYLMEQWLKDLKAKYPVTVNQQVLSQVIPK